MISDLPIGRALRRFRRLHGVKQSHAAELLGVSQGSVSRWEGGFHEPDDLSRERIVAMIAAQASNSGDGAIKRLIQNSREPVHLICDATHRLLAASSVRAAAWQVDTDALLGTSLWRFASPEIIEAEDGLVDRGWFDRPHQTLCFRTGGNGSSVVPVRPSLMQWETIALADGRVGRITTTIS
jgi:transcriptional regulator with XRE-family HTH domain